MTFQRPGQSDSKMTQYLTLSQRRVIFGARFESLFVDPEKSFLSHRKSHFWGRDLWPNSTLQSYWSAMKGFACLGFQNCRKQKESAKQLVKPLPSAFISGSEKRVFWKRGLFRKVHFPEILENLEILEILETPQTVENKGESDHFLETLENLEM